MFTQQVLILNPNRSDDFVWLFTLLIYDFYVNGSQSRTDQFFCMHRITKTMMPPYNIRSSWMSLKIINFRNFWTVEATYCMNKCVIVIVCVYSVLVQNCWDHYIDALEWGRSCIKCEMTVQKAGNPNPHCVALLIIPLWKLSFTYIHHLSIHPSSGHILAAEWIDDLLFYGVPMITKTRVCAWAWSQITRIDCWLELANSKMTQIRLPHQWPFHKFPFFSFLPLMTLSFRTVNTTHNEWTSTYDTCSTQSDVLALMQWYMWHLLYTNHM